MRRATAAWLGACVVGLSACGARSSLDVYPADSRAGGSSKQADASRDAAPRDSSIAKDSASDVTFGRDAALDVHRGKDAIVDVAEVGPPDARDAPVDHSIIVIVQPPRPVAPLSTAHVTRRRPTFHWALAHGGTGAIVDLCADRACTTPLGSPTPVDGTTYAPPTDLPTGVVYWRLHPIEQPSVSSPTWELFVGAADTVVDSSWGTTLDVNGDGFADLAVGATADGPGLGAVYVYLGSAAGLSTTPAVTLSGSSPADHMGEYVTGAGDVDGDGYADLLVSTRPSLNGPLVSNIYLGSAEGLMPAPSLSISLPAGQLDPLIFVGDLNGDGYADFVAGPNIYLGSPVGPPSAPTTTLTLVADPQGPTAVASAGDFNGDGYADLVVGPTGQSLREAGVISIYLGGPNGVPAEPNTGYGFDGPPTMSFFAHFTGAADFDGDGFADVGVAGESLPPQVVSQAVFVFLGGTVGIQSITPGLAGQDGTGPDVFPTGECAGDVNGDGYGDFLVNDELVGSLGGAVESSAALHLGSTSGISQAASESFASHPHEDGYAVSAGDVNGDGYGDVAVVNLLPPLAPGAGLSVANVSVYLGGPMGLAATPSVVLTQPAGNAQAFGSAVYGASN